MSKHHKSSIRLILIVLISAFIWKYWLNLELGYGLIFLIAAVACTIYLKNEAAKKEKNEKNNLI